MLDKAMKFAMVIVFAGVAGIRLAAQTSDATISGKLAHSHLTMKSIKEIDLGKNSATLPLYKGHVKGATVWYEITDVSDEKLASELGLNFAPRLKNAASGCPGCIQDVQTSEKGIGPRRRGICRQDRFLGDSCLYPGPKRISSSGG